MVVTQALVRELVSHFLRVGGYGGLPPRIYLRADERWRKGARKHGFGRSADLDCAWTIHGGKMPRPSIWLNTSAHDNLTKLTDTCAHEVAHIVTGLNIHTKRFWACHGALLAGKMP